MLALHFHFDITKKKCFKEAMQNNNPRINKDPNLVMSDSQFITIIQKCATLMREIENGPQIYTFEEFTRAWRKYEYLINFSKDHVKDKFMRSVSPMLYYQAYTFISEMEMYTSDYPKNNSYMSN